MNKNTVVVLTHQQKEYDKILKTLNLLDLEIIIPENPDAAEQDAAKANILFASPGLAKKYINEAKNVIWVQSVFVGVDQLNVPELRKDYVLTNVHNVYGEVMAEYVFSYILLFEKEILKNIGFQKQGLWNLRQAGLVKGKTLGILGAGSIGKDVARLAKAFNLRTVGYRSKKEPVEFFDKIFSGQELKELLSQSDYVVSVLPRTKETDNLINAQTLSYMKQTAVFINIGRGNAVNEQDLVQALGQKKIANAVLDVFKEEPLPKQSPLWHTDNLYVTPHMSGNIINGKIFEIFADNYMRFIKGEELEYRVDFAKGY